MLDIEGGHDFLKFLPGAFMSSFKTVKLYQLN